MNVKCGHALWTVKNKHPVWKDHSLAVSGIASSKGKGGISLGFVGTINEDLNKCFSEQKKIKGKQTYSPQLFQGIFIQWIQNWFKKNGNKLPKVLTLYREGLNNVQAKVQFELEVQGLLNAVDLVKQKAKQPDYNPVITYFLVNKKPNSRIF